jgi:hypothetical protein
LVAAAQRQKLYAAVITNMPIKIILKTLTIRLI